MRIVDIRERTVPIASAISNAYINFSKMTLSLVAVVTDVIRDGKPVVGFGFNSNGRYGQGSLIRERFRPRLLEADPKSLLSAAGDNLDPHKAWEAMFSMRSPGGMASAPWRSERSDMAIWDAVAKIAERPLFECLPSNTARVPPTPASSSMRRAAIIIPTRESSP